MIAAHRKKKIEKIWDNYINIDQKVFDTKGNELPNINESRLVAIEKLKDYINAFSKGESDISEFKTSIDSFNKRNNLWGFTATKGQMFFNQLVKSSEHNIDALTSLLKQSIAEPKDLQDALVKIDSLEKYCMGIFSKAKDKRKVPNPGSVGYFLSYFWQIHDNEMWPILYTSLTNAYLELEIWDAKPNQKETYEYFFNLNEEIKKVLKEYTKQEITNWDAEHAFWNFKGNPNKPKEKIKEPVIAAVKDEPKLSINASFDITDYLIPKIAKLVELGGDSKKSASAKGSEYEKMVAEVFKLLGFEVEIFGQGTGRNPDAIVKFREEHTAFIVDVKAYNEGYVMGRDDRAMREYISNFCPKLRKDGFTKIGFIIVSNSFKTDLNEFANDITWNTDIKRFILLSSEALLYYLAYKTKDDKITLPIIIESLIRIGTVIAAQNVIEEFDDI